MRKSALLILLATFCTGIAVAQSASHVKYKWKDAQGSLHFADALPPEAVEVGYDIVNAQGIVVKHVDRAKTPGELKAAQEEAKRKQETQRQNDQQNRNDQQMLSAYATVDELAKAQLAQIDAIDQNITSAKTGIANEEKTLADFLARAGEIEHNGQPVPPTLTKHIADLRNSLNDHNAYIARREAEKVDLAKKFEVQQQHYRDLVKAAKEGH
ncbi:DUF4124 domain-containing protein [Pseudolysobacter antarcticus]|uniref:DUF4124 domain-containing protein n=1 Tax=Pseudolysobacter antarcticus TaxID=2511995 RepID=A0A411HF90_9GAMM|nr:DUF4124 domain-containing protein [Pseudolysobacter antarcticus]QBB69148.1 DUF4124 domain-containing protein [Pseudolysobacter antarcticus]